uniref:Uncharacterized protein n=1 Tax=Siphoviridae sp. ct7es18 TaxID=2826166 RepID=A0A8S5MH81_9CAUD|nr:MAG TPA: hypothetical protein [Siphoviridae sp. ct7es18]
MVIFPNSFSNSTTSLPSRGAWIEISSKLYMSPPSRGAWIKRNRPRRQPWAVSK